MDSPLQPADISDYLGQPSDAEIALQGLFRRQAPLVILDIGCCEGEDSVRYARRFPNSKVFSFEPLPTNQNLARANFERYRIKNAELIPLALSDQAGEATFHVSSGRPETEFAGKDFNYGNKSSSLLPPAANDPMYGWIEFKKKITVPTGTLDDFCASRQVRGIDFIHMDVQGAEHLVIAGAAEMLPRTTAVWLEVSDAQLYSGQKLRNEMHELMRGLGFSLAFEVKRELEGDQFYVNRRMPRSWRFLAVRRAWAVWGRVRRAGGKLKSKISR